MLKVECSVTAFASGFAMIFHVPAKVMNLPQLHPLLM